LTVEQKAEFALLFQKGEAVALQTFQMLFQVCPATKAYVHSLDCIFTAIDYECETMIRWLHSCNVNFNQQSEVDLNTPLMYAVLMSKPEMVLIISQLEGIDLDLQDFEGDTALQHASLKQDVLSWNWLEAAGADQSIANNFGKLPKKVVLQIPQ
jgi:ankyrin repeat protein